MRSLLLFIPIFLILVSKISLPAELIMPDLTKYKTIIKPLKDEPGYWVGAPAVLLDNKNNIWLVYRIRVKKERGIELHIAKSKDGINFEDVKVIKKEEFGCKSLERAEILQDEKTRKYILFVSLDINGFRIYKLDDVDDPSEFDPQTKKLVLSPSGNWRTTDAHGVKDPIIIKYNNKYYMFYIGGTFLRDYANLAISKDLINWKKYKNNPVLKNQGWHNYSTRISCVLPINNEYLVFYGGSAKKDYDPIFHIKTGIAKTKDLINFEDLSKKKPVLVSPTPSEKYNTLRYIDYIKLGNKLLFYYEVATRNGGYELRVTTHIIGIYNGKVKR